MSRGKKTSRAARSIENDARERGRTLGRVRDRPNTRSRRRPPRQIGSVLFGLVEREKVRPIGRGDEVSRFLVRVGRASARAEGTTRGRTQACCRDALALACARKTAARRSLGPRGVSADPTPTTWTLAADRARAVRRPILSVRPREPHQFELLEIPAGRTNGTHQPSSLEKHRRAPLSPPPARNDLGHHGSGCHDAGARPRRARASLLAAGR